MYNIIEFARHEFRTFDQLPFGEVDSLILSWLSYLFFPTTIGPLESEAGIPLRELFRAEYFDSMVDGVKFPEDSLALFTAVAASPRYRKLNLFRYEQLLDQSISTQFAAVTFELEDGLYYVAFRGTDDTFVGWKEDFDMALPNPVPGQLLARDYLQEIVRLTEGDIMVGGHSKGGNLSVFASAMCDEWTRSHVKRIFSHDGPGFSETMLANQGFTAIRDKIEKTLPQSSMIGMTFEQECEYRIIKSHENGIMQHNPFSWEVEEDHLVAMDSLTPDARMVYNSVNRWIKGLDLEAREMFINVIFDILYETGASSFDELGANLQKDIPIIARSIHELDSETRKFMIRTIRGLAASGAKTIPVVLWNREFPEFQIKLPGKKKEKNA